MTQAELARRAQTSQTAVAAYESGQKSPRIDTLERLAHAMGARLELAIVSLAVDEDRERPIEALSREERRSLWLHRAIAARIQEQPAVALALGRRNLANLGMIHGSGRNRHWQDEWEALLTEPLDTVLAALCSTSTHASQLRQTAPFAGLLTPRQRWAIYRSFGGFDEARTA